MSTQKTNNLQNIATEQNINEEIMNVTDQNMTEETEHITENITEENLTKHTSEDSTHPILTSENEAMLNEPHDSISNDSISMNTSTDDILEESIQEPLQETVLKTSTEREFERDREEQTHISSDKPITIKAPIKTKKKKEKKIPIPEEAGIAQKLFSILSYLALPTLILFTLALSFQQFLFPRDFWFSEEVRFADVYMNMLASGNFFSLTLNGHAFAEAGPLYFLSIFAIDSIPNINMPQAFFIASSLFASFYIIATWLFARILGLGRQGAFAAGLIALCTFFFIGLSNYNRVDLLHAAFLNISFLFFYNGWKKKNGFFSLTLAFIFLALSVLLNGFLYLLIPFIAGFFFLIWAGKLRRITGGDGLLGFFFFLIIVIGWYGLLYYYGHSNFIRELVDVQIIAPFAKATYTQPLWYYLPAFVCITLPWFLLLFFADWLKYLKEIPQYFKNRKENASTAWLICLIIASLTLLTFTHDKKFINLMPLMPVLAILLAKILLSLSAMRSKIFYITLACFVFFVGIFFLLFEFHALIFAYLPHIWILPQEIPTYIKVATTNTSFGMAIMGGLFILTAIILWNFTRKTQTGGALLISSLGLIISVQPFSMLVAPQLDIILSTQAQATLMAEYEKKGYAPATFGIYPDVYTYYYNVALTQNLDGAKQTYPQKHIVDLNDTIELNHFISTHPKVVLALTKEDWQKLTNTMYAEEIQTQWLESKEVMITLWEAPQLLQQSPQAEKDILSETEELSSQDANSNNLIPEELLPEEVYTEETFLEKEFSEEASSSIKTPSDTLVDNKPPLLNDIQESNLELTIPEANNSSEHITTVNTPTILDIENKNTESLLIEETSTSLESTNIPNETILDSTAEKQVENLEPQVNTNNNIFETTKLDTSDKSIENTIEISPEDSFLFEKDIKQNTNE